VPLAYCTVQNVTAQFPGFVPDQANNTSTATIQDWIDEAGAFIYALFLARGITVGATTLTLQQTAILKMLNRESGTRDLANVLRYSTAAQDMSEFGADPNTPKTMLPAGRFRDGRFSSIMAGQFDRLFMPTTARTVSISPTIQGSVAGGDTQRGLTPEAEGLNMMFGVNTPY
jgi:hypothetical protein